MTVKGTDNRFELAAGIAVDFAKSFLKNIPSDRFWLFITYP